MRFNSHSDLVGRHAFLSASKGSWVNYTDDKLMRSVETSLAAARGTALHDFARQAIMLGERLPNTKRTMNMYVNDAIGLRMQPEVILFYSNNAFGTADTISFRKNKLRIHDLKTGITPTNMRQLEIYVAFFCLEYGFLPSQIEVELRIYQNNEIKIHIPEVDDITHIMDRIVTFDRYINDIREEAYS